MRELNLGTSSAIRTLSEEQPLLAWKKGKLRPTGLGEMCKGLHSQLVTVLGKNEFFFLQVQGEAPMIPHPHPTHPFPQVCLAALGCLPEVDKQGSPSPC